MDFLITGAILSAMFYFFGKHCANNRESEIKRNIRDCLTQSEINELRRKLGLPPRELY